MNTLTDSIRVQKTKHSRISEIDFNNLEFGKHLSDHMFVAEYDKGQWLSSSVVPYADLTITPANLALHYGQSVFEGLKAYRNKDGNVSIFRALKHHQRLLKSLDRMCMPAISEELFIHGLHTLLEVDEAWVPATQGASLYIRPLVFATESRLGVKVSDQYKFIIMTSPVGPYLNKPFTIKVEDHHTRAAEGGTGYAKCAGNYGGAFYPTQLARQQGYDQVLWTDHKEHKYIDEAGMMNVMFVFKGKLVTPRLSSAILDGVTRDSILTLAKDMGFPVEERKVSVEELEKGIVSGALTEIFGAGTAAVVAPIANINIGGKDYTIPVASEDSFQNRVKQKLHDIRLGYAPDVHEWNHVIPIK
jgi:branched-chain amino acid aminotransferase